MGRYKWAMGSRERDNGEGFAHTESAEFILYTLGPFTFIVFTSC